MVLKAVCVTFHLVHIPHSQGTELAECIVETGVLVGVTLLLTVRDAATGARPWLGRTMAMGQVHKWEPSHMVAVTQHRRRRWWGQRSPRTN